MVRVCVFWLVRDRDIEERCVTLTCNRLTEMSLLLDRVQQKGMSLGMNLPYVDERALVEVAHLNVNDIFEVTPWRKAQRRLVEDFTTGQRLAVIQLVFDAHLLKGLSGVCLCGAVGSVVEWLLDARAESRTGNARGDGRQSKNGVTLCNQT